MEGLKEGFSTVKRCRKVLFCREHLKNYLQIEMELIAAFLSIHGNLHPESCPAETRGRADGGCG